MKSMHAPVFKEIHSNSDINEPTANLHILVLVRYDIVNNNYQQDSRVFCTFIPNKSFGQLLEISPKNFIFLKTEFSYI